jgi:hypothetical protein
MATGIYFKLQGVSADTYDEISKRLEQAGAAAPAGRNYHFAWAGPDGMEVFDVWESEDAFEKFGETLMPIMGELGADPGPPAVFEVHNTIIG